MYNPKHWLYKVHPGQMSEVKYESWEKLLDLVKNESVSVMIDDVKVCICTHMLSVVTLLMKFYNL